MTEYPLITFALFCYNQEEYIKEAITGALSQTYPNLEILISDDGSTDRTFEIANATASKYQGKHKIRMNKNSNNLGIVDHVNKIFEISSGQFIVAAAGDDVSLPDRVSEIYKKFHETNALLVHSGCFEMDSQGALSGRELPDNDLSIKMSPSKAAWSQSIYIGATGAWSKELVNRCGGIKYRHAYEDQVLGFRAIIQDRIAFINKPLVKYRTNIGVSHTQRGAEKRLLNCIDLQKQKISDLVILKPRSPKLFFITSGKLILCLAVYCFRKLRNVLNRR